MSRQLSVIARSYQRGVVKPPDRRKRGVQIPWPGEWPVLTACRPAIFYEAFKVGEEALIPRILKGVRKRLTIKEYDSDRLSGSGVVAVTGQSTHYHETLMSLLLLLQERKPPQKLLSRAEPLSLLMLKLSVTLWYIRWFNMVRRGGRRMAAMAPLRPF
jgi:hypothetical protein